MIKMKKFNLDVYLDQPKEFVLESLTVQKGEKVLSLENDNQLHVYDIDAGEFVFLKRSLEKLDSSVYESFTISEPLHLKAVLTLLQDTIQSEDSFTIEGNCLFAKRSSYILYPVLHKSYHYVLFVKYLEAFVVVTHKQMID